jgi:hypothetical protein
MIVISSVPIMRDELIEKVLRRSQSASLASGQKIESKLKKSYGFKPYSVLLRSSRE